MAGGKVGKDSRKAKMKAISHTQRATILENFTIECTTFCHLQPSIHGDEELNSLVQAADAGGGVIPHTHDPLTEKKGQQKTI
uniref:Histone H2A C-terminal domain-containing protein n=1 Tax=Castor canadensis TaxID=51338 RepID=A0A8C0WIB5_CASCN